MTPDIETSTREERLEFIREEFKCLGNCPICGKCNFLRGREAEDLYADYIEGHRSFRDITAEHRNSGRPFRTWPQGGGQGFRPAQEGRSHRITCPLQVAAGRVRSDLLKIEGEAVGASSSVIIILDEQLVKWEFDILIFLSTFAINSIVKQDC